MSEPITYTITISGREITLSGSDGTTSMVDLPEQLADENTTYTLTVNCNILTLTGSDGTTPNEVSIPVVTYSLQYVSDLLSLVGSDDSVSQVPITEGDGGGGSSLTYTLSLDSENSNTIVLTSSTGMVQTVTPTDENTTYGLSLSNDTLSLVTDGSGTNSVALSDENTTYGLEITGSTLTLSVGGSDTEITLPTYELTFSGGVLALVMDGSGANSVTVPDEDNNTTYTFTLNGNNLEVTPLGGNTQSIDLSGLSGTGTTYTFDISGRDITLTNDGDSTDVQTVTLPADSDTIYTAEFEDSSRTLTLTPSSGTAQTITIPDANDDTTYTLTFTNGALSLVDGEGTIIITHTIPDNDTNTTYDLSYDSGTRVVTLRSNDPDEADDTFTLPESTSTASYTLTFADGTLTLVDGTTGMESVTIPDENTTYGLRLRGNVLSLVEGGEDNTLTLPLADTSSLFDTESLGSMAIEVLTSGSIYSTGIIAPSLDDTEWILVNFGAATIGTNIFKSGTWYLTRLSDLLELDAQVSASSTSFSRSTVLTFVDAAYEGNYVYLGRTAVNEILAGTDFINVELNPFSVHTVTGLDTVEIGSSNVIASTTVLTTVSTGISIPSPDDYEWLLLNFGHSASNGDDILKRGNWHLIRTSDLTNLSSVTIGATIDSSTQDNYILFSDTVDDNTDVYLGVTSNNILVLASNDTNTDFIGMSVRRVISNLYTERVSSQNVSVSVADNFYGTGATIPSAVNVEWLLMNLGADSATNGNKDGDWRFIRKQNLLDLAELTTSSIFGVDTNDDILHFPNAAGQSTDTADSIDISLGRTTSNEILISSRKVTEFNPLAFRQIVEAEDATAEAQEGTISIGTQIFQHLLWQQANAKPSISLRWTDDGWDSSISPWANSRTEAGFAGEHDSSVDADAPFWIATSTSTRSTDGVFVYTVWTVVQEFGVEYSEDSDTWHDDLENDDNYIRFRLPDGSFSDAIRITSTVVPWVKIFDNRIYETDPYPGDTSKRRYSFNQNLTQYRELLYAMTPIGNAQGTEEGIRYWVVVSGPSVWGHDDDDDVLRANNWYIVYHKNRGLHVGKHVDDDWAPDQPNNYHESDGSLSIPVVVSYRFKFVGSSESNITHFRAFDFEDDYIRNRLQIYGRA